MFSVCSFVFPLPRSHFYTCNLYPAVLSPFSPSSVYHVMLCIRSFIPCVILGVFQCTRLSVILVLFIANPFSFLPASLLFWVLTLSH